MFASVEVNLSSAAREFDGGVAVRRAGVEVASMTRDGDDCWSSPDGDQAFVQLTFTRDNRLEDNGRPTPIAGTTSYVAPEEDGDRSCVVHAPHRTYTNSVGDPTVELFRLTVRGEQPTAKACALAEDLSATALKNIAKRLPEGT
ncbi:hypothetical protein [Streptomyces sp. NPDC057740]|uniref:hypothetical protein n=1 Tax=Streptomyces sp. NPDC057740 TaxID=3346234 RepID=UPI0036CD8C00